jgi:hypothetical protein
MAIWDSGTYPSTPTHIISHRSFGLSLSYSYSVTKNSNSISSFFSLTLLWKILKQRWSIARGSSFENYPLKHFGYEVTKFVSIDLLIFRALFSNIREVRFAFKFQSIELGLQNTIFSIQLNPIDKKMEEALKKWRQGLSFSLLSSLFSHPHRGVVAQNFIVDVHITSHHSRLQSFVSCSIKSIVSSLFSQYLKRIKKMNT